MTAPAKVFISYAHDDAGTAARVAAALREAKVDVWIDESEMGPGDSFIERMNEGLGPASYVLFLVSSASVRSRYVSMEWMSALARKEVVVLPLRIEPVELPPLLRDRLYIDLTKGVEAGLRELKTFFAKEDAAALPAVRAAKASMLSSATRRELRLAAKRCLIDHDFAECLWDLGIPPDDVIGNNLQEKLLFLLQRMDSEGAMGDFIAWLEENRRNCVHHQLTLLRSATG